MSGCVSLRISQVDQQVEQVVQVTHCDMVALRLFHRSSNPQRECRGCWIVRFDVDTLGDIPPEPRCIYADLKLSRFSGREVVFREVCSSTPTIRAHPLYHEGLISDIPQGERVSDGDPFEYFSEVVHGALDIDLRCSHYSGSQGDDD